MKNPSVAGRSKSLLGSGIWWDRSLVTMNFQCFSMTERSAQTWSTHEESQGTLPSITMLLAGLLLPHSWLCLRQMGCCSVPPDLYPSLHPKENNIIRSQPRSKVPGLFDNIRLNTTFFIRAWEMMIVFLQRNPVASVEGTSSQFAFGIRMILLCTW